MSEDLTGTQWLTPLGNPALVLGREPGNDPYWRVRYTDTNAGYWVVSEFTILRRWQRVHTDTTTGARTLEGELTDDVNHPSHYTGHPSGVECIQITEHMNFCLGNAIKYLWRADEKGSPIQDLKKARWYVDREIQRREKVQGDSL